MGETHFALSKSGENHTLVTQVQAENNVAFQHLQDLAWREGLSQLLLHWGLSNILPFFPPTAKDKRIWSHSSTGWPGEDPSAASAFGL